MRPDILLFHPPNILKPNALRYSSISPLICGYGLLHIGAHLKRLGYNVECWNIPLAYKLGLKNNHIKGILKTYDPLLVGIELNWLHLSKGALDLADFLKDLYTNVPIVVGGVHATLFADQIIKFNDAIDVVVKGEAEKIMEDLANKIEKKQDYRRVIGTISKENGRIIKNEGKNIHENLDLIPPYSPNLLMPKKLNPYNLAIINTCRGPCNFDCIHCLGAKSKYCLSTRSKITFHSISWIIKQIQLLLDHTNKISIQDYIYCNPKFIIELCKAIQRENLQDSIDYFNIAIVPTQNINNRVMNELAKAGVDNIDIGIESGSDYILKHLKRPYNTYQASVVIKNAIENGILPKTYWMITGFERQTDLHANQQLLKNTIKLGAIPKWVTPLCIIPKTELHYNARKYKINLKLSSFQDYLRFSTEKFNRNAYYPPLVTHETNLMTIYDILKAVNEIKTLILHNEDIILEKLEENKKYYLRVHPKLYEPPLIQRTEASLKYIRSTFF
ncbi:MAG: cobalamin B12-binding domain-containing protein [Candidatus Helarchaeota archaeon]|nr:cobalamin B12-binding domain-containing protein [Candidatus Helarchaeota archaeon]